MSIGSYITQLKEEMNVSYKELASMLNMSYQNMINLKDDEGGLPSPRVLNTLSEFQHKGKEEVVYGMLIDMVPEDYPIDVLEMLCKEYSDGMLISPKEIPLYIYEDYPRKKRIKTGRVFAGSSCKKRSGNTLTVFDSWDHLKEEHLSQFKINKNPLYDTDVWKVLFKSEKEYLNSVFYYAISKLYIAEDNIINYSIVFNQRNKEDIKKLYKLTAKLGVNIQIGISKFEFSTLKICNLEQDYLIALHQFAMNYEIDNGYRVSNDLKLACFRALKLVVENLDDEDALLESYIYNKIPLLVEGEYTKSRYLDALSNIVHYNVEIDINLDHITRPLSALNTGKIGMDVFIRVIEELNPLVELYNKNK